jgi:hypothetical protein
VHIDQQVIGLAAGIQRRDRAGQFTEAFDAVLAAAGMSTATFASTGGPRAVIWTAPG